MPNLIRPPEGADSLAFLRMLYLKTEQRLIDEIKRKRASEYADYAEVAALKRTQQILQEMVDESWNYVPKMIENIFFHSDKAAGGYANAAGMTATQLNVVQQLSNNLLGDIVEASATAQKSVESALQVGRQEAGSLRKASMQAVVEEKAAGYGTGKAAVNMAGKLQQEGITAFVDKAGRKWSLQDYCNMAVRATARQAEVSAILTADPDHDLYKISKVGSTCPVCAPLEGRIYSRSGNNPEYPPLAAAFGKINPAGGNDLSNTYLNIHPNCLHALTKYTTMGKSDAQIQKDKDFSSFEKNPVSADPRSKKQIEAYKEKVRNRQRLLSDIKQHQEYRRILGSEVPKTFESFRDMKYNKAGKWDYIKGLKEYLQKYPTSDKRYYNVQLQLKKAGINIGIPLPPVKKQAFILPEGKKDPLHIMKRMLERDITDDDVKSYMSDAKIMFSQWGGARQRFVSEKGMVVITRKDDGWIYKTAWKKADYDEEADKIMEVLRKNGI